MANKDIVVQANTLLPMSRNDWTLQEYKIFLYLVSRVDSMNDNDFRLVRLHASEFAKIVGLKGLGYVYTDLERLTDKMLSRVFRVETEKDITKFQALSRAKYIKGSGMLELTIHQDMKPFLLEISKNFTAYELNHISKMSSLYALRIYELTKMFEGLKEITYELNSLKKKLGIKADELSNFADFDKRVLKIAQREINSKTDMRLSYEPIKEGRKVTQIMFKVRFVKPRKPTAEIIQLPVRKNGSCEAIGSISDNLLESFKPLTTTKKIGIKKRSIGGISSCKDMPKASIIKNKPTKKTTLVSRVEKPKNSDILELKLSAWQRLKYLFIKAFRE